VHGCVYGKANREGPSNTKEQDAIPAGQLRHYGLVTLLSLLKNHWESTYSLNRCARIPWVYPNKCTCTYSDKSFPWESLLLSNRLYNSPQNALTKTHLLGLLTDIQRNQQQSISSDSQQ